MTLEERIAQLETQITWAAEKIAFLTETAASQQEQINNAVDSIIKLFDHPLLSEVSKLRTTMPVVCDYRITTKFPPSVFCSRRLQAQLVRRWRISDSVICL